MMFNYYFIYMRKKIFSPVEEEINEVTEVCLNDQAALENIQMAEVEEIPLVEVQDIDEVAEVTEVDEYEQPEEYEEDENPYGDVDAALYTAAVSIGGEDIFF